MPISPQTILDNLTVSDKAAMLEVDKHLESILKREFTGAPVTIEWVNMFPGRGMNDDSPHVTTRQIELVLNKYRQVGWRITRTTVKKTDFRGDNCDTEAWVFSGGDYVRPWPTERQPKEFS